jgi:FkbM family methyltransferase
MVTTRFHRRVRALTRHYPWTNGAAFFNRLMGRLCDRDQPQWVASGSFAGYPNLALDLAANPQRKVFYFPRAYGAFYWKKPLAAFLAAELRPGSAFLDIGANLGMFSLLAARLVGPSGTVVAFEPDPSTFESLARTIALNRLAHVRAYNVALSDHGRRARLLRARDGCAHSLLPEAPGRGGRYCGDATVEVSTLDDVATRCDLGAISVVKIDVEGEEPRTVAGMLRTLERASFPPVWCEVRGPAGSTRAPDTFAAVLRQLAPLGYRAYRWNGAARPVDVAAVRGREDILFRAGTG